MFHHICWANKLHIPRQVVFLHAPPQSQGPSKPLNPCANCSAFYSPLFKGHSFCPHTLVFRAAFPVISSSC